MRPRSSFFLVLMRSEIPFFKSNFFKVESSSYSRAESQISRKKNSQFFAAVLRKISLSYKLKHWKSEIENLEKFSS